MFMRLQKCILVGVIAALMPLAYAAEIKHSADQPITREQQQKMTPKMVLERLKAGNKRFTKGEMTKYDYSSKREISSDGQHPIAIVLACVDSRSIPDLIFDQGLGNIFVARVAGNVTNQDILGSEEFATKHVGAKVIVVMGHTSCGAVQSACKGVGEGNLRALLNKISPAVNQLKMSGEKNCASSTIVNDIAKQNVINQVIATYEVSTVIKKLVDDGKVMLVGAMHDLASGHVDFFYEFKPKKQS